MREARERRPASGGGASRKAASIVAAAIGEAVQAETRSA